MINPLSLPSEDLVNGGIVGAAVLATLLVAFSTYGRLCCRHPAFRFFVWGASTVFLPLTSSIITSLLKRSTEPDCDGSQPRKGKANPNIQNMWTLLLWIVLILTIKCNADVAAAAVTVAAASPAGGDASFDGQRIRPPVEHLAMYAWLGYLIWLCVPVAGWLGSFNRAVFFAFSALGLVKLALKLAAFWSASGSFALGKNARLVAGYMVQRVSDDGGDEQAVPRYIVMGETKKDIEESAQGYRIKRYVLDNKFSTLVTLDRVWRLAENGGSIIAERPELRDLCLSYSLFKLLRRRLSGHPLADAGSAEALDFVLRGMDSVCSGVDDADRMFRVLVDELWFASDFYYSPIPLCIFGGWCAALNYLCSVLLIVGAVAVGWIYQVKDVVHSTPYKVVTFSLLMAVVLVEAWEVVAGVCSNWTKMALLGHYIRHEKSWRRCRFVHATLAGVLRLWPARRWCHRIGQNSVLEPRRFLRRSWLLSEKLYGKAGLMRSIEVSPAVKVAVIRSLLSSYGRMSKGSSTSAARRVGGKVDWALYGGQKSWAWEWDGEGSSSNTELLLAWHVATRLFELKSTSASADLIAASHLSNYFAYLVVAAPELLPDCAEWSKKRYKEVSEDVSAALGADSGGGESAKGRYECLVPALSDQSRDAVLRRGAELGRQLVEQCGEDEAPACRKLVDFWSEMALYVAPSENVKGHVQAMARGGEFITLVWALLLHAGITTRPDTPGGAAIP